MEGVAALPTLNGSQAIMPWPGFRLLLGPRLRIVDRRLEPLTSSASVQGSYLAGSHDLATGGSGGEPRRVVGKYSEIL